MINLFQLPVLISVRYTQTPAHTKTIIIYR